jgi:ABC-type lipoprotein release transport system permease subunit
MPRQTRSVGVVVRTTGNPADLTGSVRRRIEGVDRAAIVYDVATMPERVARQWTRARFTSWLMGVLAGLALLLATLGVHGVLSQMVRRRRAEIGLRLALGASRGGIVASVVRRAVVLVGGGAVLGLLGAAGLVGLVRRLLFDVTLGDPGVIVGIALFIVGVGATAAWLPAARAARVDPLTVLRQQ